MKLSSYQFGIVCKRRAWTYRSFVSHNLKALSVFKTFHLGLVDVLHNLTNHLQPHKFRFERELWSDYSLYYYVQNNNLSRSFLSLSLFWQIINQKKKKWPDAFCCACFRLLLPLYCTFSQSSSLTPTHVFLYHC